MNPKSLCNLFFSLRQESTMNNIFYLPTPSSSGGEAALLVLGFIRDAVASELLKETEDDMAHGPGQAERRGDADVLAR